MKSLILSAVAAATLAMGSAHAAPMRAPAEPQASIPFVNYGGIRNWQAADSRTLYLQDNHRQWYKAEMFGPCMNLPYAVAIGFETRGLDRFDRFSTVKVGGERCQVNSVALSDGPPKAPSKAHGRS